VNSDAPDLTVLLHRINGGDKDAEGLLYDIVSPELRKFASYLMSGERRDHTLQATELVNRAYLRLAGRDLSLRDRAHFFAIVARAMRRELIDYARTRKEVDLVPVDWLLERTGTSSDSIELAVLIDELLDSMREVMPLEYSIVELKCFLGMTDGETASMLGLPLRTMQLRWHDARIWLFERAIAKGWKPKGAGE
jgi:RNA polymerase sigma factor (TIGR02999 family)